MVNEGKISVWEKIRTKVLTFLPSRNLTFPSIIQLLSTIVEGRYYRTAFRCFSHHYMKAFRLLNAAYWDTMEHLGTPWTTMLPGARFPFLLTEQQWQFSFTNHAAKSILRTDGTEHPSWQSWLAACTAAVLLPFETVFCTLSIPLHFGPVA